MTILSKRLVNLALAVALLLSGIGIQALASPTVIPSISQQATARSLLIAQQTGAPLSEVANLVVAPIDDTLAPEEVMRSRPFILPWGSNPAFIISETPAAPLTEQEAFAELEYFLSLRDLSEDEFSFAIESYTDPEVIEIVPAPALRAALLMMTAWDPYEVVIEAILEGNNPSGLPFQAVDFDELDYEDAIATLVEDPRSGRYEMLLDNDYASEAPQQLLPVIVHESLHGGGWNSAEEEIIANILDAICYAELLLIDPSAAFTRSELAVFNNVQVYALLNSSGRRGAGQIGIATSVAGDVYVGPGLEGFNAASIREAIVSDGFYSTLGAGGSPGQATTTALINRFPGSSSLGEEPPYTEEMLAVIDRGVGRILPPESVLALAILLGFGRTVELQAPVGIDPAPAELSLSDRPFTPIDRSQFDLNLSRRGAFSLSPENAPAVLEEILRRGEIDDAAIDEALALLDDPAVIELIPEPVLRVALLLLAAYEPWDVVIDAVLGGANSFQDLVTVQFADLPTDAPAVWSEWNARPEVLINSLLVGERPEVLAAAIAEAVMLDAERPTENQVVASALMGTLAYGSIVLANPEIAGSQTWWTMVRNRDLVALLNSGTWVGSRELSNANTVGFLAAAGPTDDVLPGFIYHAESFDRYASQSSRGHDASPSRAGRAPQAMQEILEATDIPLRIEASGLLLNNATMNALDSGLYRFLDEENVLELATLLNLGIQSD
jgi:hypothetical protein